MRNLPSTAGVLFLSLALLMTLSALAQQPGSSPDASSPDSYSPSSQQSQPAAPPSTAPNNPSAVGQSAPQNQAQGQTDEENPLGLTEDQKAQLRPIVMDETKQMDSVRSDSSLSQDQKITKINQIRETASPKIKAILTPEQLQKLADLQRSRQQQENQSKPSESQQPPK